MKKRIILTIVGLVVLIGVLGGIKSLQILRMTADGKQFVPPPETVTAYEVHMESWESLLTSVGSLEAVQGVMVTAELTGKGGEHRLRTRRKGTGRRSSVTAGYLFGDGPATVGGG